MKSPLNAVQEAWTKKELAEIERQALQAVQDTAESGIYISYEASLFAIKLSYCQRYHENLLLKLASLGELDVSNIFGMPEEAK